MRRFVGAAAIAAIAGLAASAAPVTGQQLRSASYEFLEAVKERDGDTVTRLLEEPGSTLANARDITTGETALHIATKRRDGQWIRFLAQRGANANIADRNGVTPIAIAVNLGFLEGVEALLAAGARVDEANRAGETPLIAATHRGDTMLVRALLANGADPDRNDSSGRSARDYAQLTTGSRLMAEFERADADRAGRRTARTYGPGF